MDYRQYQPDEKLSKYIKCYWSLDSDDNAQPHSRERIFPDGCIELIFHYGDLFLKFNPDGLPEIQHRCFMHGQIKKFIEVEATGKIGMFSIRFMPAGLQPFIDFEVSDLTEKTVTLTKIWTEGQHLEKKMLDCPDNTTRIAVIEDFLLKRLEKSKPDEDIVFCVNGIIGSDGMITMEKLADSLNVSKRHLERKFLSGVGLSQKVFSRIVRFNNTLQLIEKKDFHTFTTVAHDGGFYDQAHFIKDFREFTGLNPKQYFSENLEMVKHFSLE